MSVGSKSTSLWSKRISNGEHDEMAASLFAFLRATFYRWASLWPEVCPDLAKTARVLAVGDLHVENFGTWRDAEGRLVWGVNDFDEVARMPFAADLTRLVTSAILAKRENGLAIDPSDAATAVLEGYSEYLEEGGNPFILKKAILIFARWPWVQSGIQLGSGANFLNSRACHRRRTFADCSSSRYLMTRKTSYSHTVLPEWEVLVGHDTW